jgi:hypothetical protein
VGHAIYFNHLFISHSDPHMGFGLIFRVRPFARAPNIYPPLAQQACQVRPSSLC